MVGEISCKATWILVWSAALVSNGKLTLAGRIPVACTHYHALPAAELNTHTMITSIVFWILIVGLLAYASYLRNTLKRK